MREQLGLDRRRRAIGGDELDDGLDLLAELVVRDPEHGGVGHRRMRDEHVLGLLRIDVDAARDDHVRLAVGEVEIALLVQVADVADRGPPALVARCGRLLRVVVVLERPAALRPHHPRPPRRELAPILVEDVRRADEGAPDRSAMREPVVGVDRGEQVDLRRRVVLVHDRSEPIDHLRLDLRRTWRRRVDDRAQRRQVVATPLILGQPQQADEHRGDHLHVRHPVALDQLQARAGLEAVHDHRGPAQAVYGHREAQRCRVIQRRGREVDRVLVEAV